MTSRDSFVLARCVLAFHGSTVHYSQTNVMHGQLCICACLVTDRQVVGYNEVASFPLNETTNTKSLLFYLVNALQLLHNLPCESSATIILPCESSATITYLVRVLQCFIVFHKLMVNFFQDLSRFFGFCDARVRRRYATTAGTRGVPAPAGGPSRRRDRRAVP